MDLNRHQDLNPLALLIGDESIAKGIFDGLNAQREQMIRAHLSVGTSACRAAHELTSHPLQAYQREVAGFERHLSGQLLAYGQQRAMIDAAHLGGNILESVTQSIKSARIAGRLDLPDLLQQHRLPDGALALRLTDTFHESRWMERQLVALNSHAALSNMLDQSGLCGRETLRAVEAVLATPLLGLSSMRQARHFLEISGLLKFPRFRGMTRAEKTRRIKRLVKASAAPARVRKAHSLTHSHELVLRADIARCMEDAYGENWAAERLPQCACNKLLGKRIFGDETVLDYADFAHYAAIVSHPEHFEIAFSKGFDSAEKLGSMLIRIGQLRARANHARTFTVEDYRELAILWRTVESGLIELYDGMVFDE